jgi:outer membrane protein
LVVAGPAHAEDEWSVGLAGTVGVTPYKDYDTLWTPFPLISYEGQYAYVRGFNAGIKFVNLEFLELSAFVGYDDTSFDSSASSDRRLRKLSNRYDSAVAGLEVRLITPYGMLHADGAQDVLGHSKGLNGTVGYKHSLEYGDLELIPSLGFQWNSAGYNDYYYGVSGRESRKSGLKSYDAGAGVSPYVGITLDYSLSDAWEIFCSGEVLFLSHAIKDSPMVDRSSTYTVTTGLLYNF